MRLSKTELPRKARVLDPGPCGGAGAAVAARDDDVVSLGLRDALKRKGQNNELHNEPRVIPYSP